MPEQNETSPNLDYHDGSRPLLADGASPARRKLALAVVALLLLVGAVGLNATMASLKLQFRKEAVELREPLATIAPTLGPWVQVSIDRRFPPDIEHELGTQEYIERQYVDTRHADPDVLAEWESADRKTDELRSKLLASVLRNDPMGLVRLHVAYYTGSVDTVPHIPDRCMLGGGFEMLDRGVATLPAKPLEDDTLGTRPLDVSLSRFQRPEGNGGAMRTTNVAYFFEVNGDYEHDAITGVRKRLQNLFETHAYFAKIEVAVDVPGTTPDPDAALAKGRLADFLSHVLPNVEQCLPDWEQVKAQAAATQ